MSANQRYTTILELSGKDRIVHTTKLVKLMGVSSEAIRRDPEYPGSPPTQGTRRTLSLRVLECLDAG